MKITLIISFLLLTSFANAQKEYLNYNHQAYEFLERVDNLHIIENYSAHDIPKTRSEIAGYLIQTMKKRALLSKTDQSILEDFIVEFEYDLYGTTLNSASIWGESSYGIFTDKQKYLYIYAEPGKASLFINLTGEGEVIYNNNTVSNTGSKAALGILGGELRGTIFNNFGFYIKGTNGQVFGERSAALKRENIKSNYKFNEREDETFFDETEGYITADFDLIKFKLGRDRLVKGYSSSSAFINDNSPAFDYLAMNIEYSIFTFSYFHGKLLGQSSYENDTITGGSFIVNEKYAGYHRIGFNLSRHLSLGAGELIIYGDRGLDLSYLNPFNFYKSVEHANRDRDNSMLFLDMSSNSIKGLKIYSTLLLDDISFNKIGSGWWGNQTMFSVGLLSDMLYSYIPLDLRLEYTRIEPYVFTHRLQRNSFTNFGQGLNSLKPNSGLFFSEINYRFNERLSTGLSFEYTIHGANIPDPDGSYTNVGGNLLQGHRVFDEESVTYLDGIKEYSRIYSFYMRYEPYNQILFNLRGEIINESLIDIVRNEINIFAGLSVIF